MTEKSRGDFIGTWRWDKTSVRQWFAIGSDVYLEYTPANQGFEYYCNITADGKYEGYLNSELVHLFTLSDVEWEIKGQLDNVLALYIDCSQELLGFDKSNLTNDTIRIQEYPLNFHDEENNLETIRNYFVRE
ncbi:MAG: hypothetical protein QNK23_00480 [Crocinitomicaceae bacterium]|nr:hypothetical protein [Crocinitomicaceae bacterium]